MHTAGEWKYSVQTGLVYVDGKGIAKVYGAVRDSASYSAEGEANARLIAGAPRMYRLLSDATGVLSQLNIGDPLAHEIEDFLYVLDGKEADSDDYSDE